MAFLGIQLIEMLIFVLDRQGMHFAALQFARSGEHHVQGSSFSPDDTGFPDWPRFRCRLNYNERFGERHGKALQLSVYIGYVGGQAFTRSRCGEK
jgi:hypothetical protein